MDQWLSKFKRQKEISEHSTVDINSNIINHEEIHVDINNSTELMDFTSKSESINLNELIEDRTSETQKQCSTSKKRNVTYNQKFKTEWTTRFGDWCKETDNKNNAYCSVCFRKIIGGITHISRHEKTLLHKKNIKKAASTTKILKILPTSEQSSRYLKVRESEFKCVMFLHEHNLPFSIMDHLPKFIRSVCSDSLIAKDLNISRTKATLITQDCFAPEALKIISEKTGALESGYSLIIDETTDISTKKSLVIVMRFFDEDIKKVTVHFFGLLEIRAGNASEIYNVILEHLKSHNVQMEKMVGLGADNASVMMGNIKGVQALLKKHNPSLFVMGCVCHSLHLCTSAATKKLPTTLEEFARGIYNFFSNSSKRLTFLHDCQSFLDEKPHKMLRPSQTRWLSLQAVVNRILEHWNSLVLVFQDAVLADNLQSFETILNNLRSPIFKVYFQFLSYILDIVNRLNLEFQSEKSKICVLSDRINNFYKTILSNFIRKECIDNIPLNQLNPSNPRHFKDTNNCYFGAKTQILLSNESIPPDHINVFKVKALDFYQELCSQVKARFSFNDPILTFCSYFDPKTATSGSVESIAVESMKHFPQVVSDVDKLDSEWRLLPYCEETKNSNHLEFEDFWAKVFKMENEIDMLMFPNLTKLVKCILTLPHSSACAERIFSQYNLLKTKTRNRLNVNTCDAILHAKDMLKQDVCYTWKPTKRALCRKPLYRENHNIECITENDK